ncbi:MAG TPA: alpha/beta hydrolase [Caulobacteraceae bacterium]|nr:alpha/beta hydrolase [Caulobacteraceae bacterium]
MPQIAANGLSFEYQDVGPRGGEAVLLIMGLGGQMTRWPPAMIEALTGRGFRVVSFDNRDVGLSAKLEAAGPPDIPAVLEAMARGAKPPVAYTLHDMAADAAGVLEALGIARAHIVGASMGGMIAQLVAADHPAKTASLTSIMSTTGNPELPRATPEAMAVITQRGPDPRQDLEGFLAHTVKGARTIGSPAWPGNEAEIRERALSDFRRSFYPVGFARQYAAVIATGDWRERLKRITAPTVIVHGADDPLVPLEGGRDTAANIAGAELVVIEGMGHDLPVPVLPRIVEAIARAAERAGKEGRAAA